MFDFFAPENLRRSIYKSISSDVLFSAHIVSKLIF